VVALATLWGCDAPKQAPVTLRFTNMNQSDETGPVVARLEAIARRYHVDGNKFGIDGVRAEPVQSINGSDLRTYQVELVVEDLRKLEDIRQAVEGGWNGDDAVEFRLDTVATDFRGTFVDATISIQAMGRVDPGSTVWIYDHGSAKAREVQVDPSGIWRASVNVRDGHDYIYGYSTHPRSPGRPKCFRVNLYTRKINHVQAANFDRLRVNAP
jgi:hypothetical protein